MDLKSLLNVAGLKQHFLALPLTHKLMWLAALLAAAAALYFLVTQARDLLRNWRIDRALSRVPTPGGCFPFLGHLLQLKDGRPWETMCIDFPRRLDSPVVRFNMFTTRVLLITEPALLERVLQTKQRFYNKHADSYKEFMCLLGTGLVTSEGKTWLHGRAMLSNAMRIEILDALPAIALQATNRMIGDLQASRARGEEFDLLGGFQRLTLQVIGSALLSLPPDECDDTFAQLYLPIVEECNARVWSPWKKAMFWREGHQAHAVSLNKLNNYFDSLIARRWAAKERGDRDPKKHPDLKLDILDLYMSQLNAMDRASAVQLRCDLKTMVLAGHETTAAMLTWAVYEVLGDRDVREKLREEHRRVFAGVDLREQLPTVSEHLDKLVFTRACLREALRKYSVVPIVMRVAMKDDFVPKEESGLSYDLSIPEGTAVMVGITSVHRNPQLWPRPDVYDPERFVRLDGNMDAVKYSFIPFIVGPRHCLGQHLSLTEAQFILSYLIAFTDLELGERASGSPHKYIVPVVPENGVPVKVKEARELF